MVSGNSLHYDSGTYSADVKKFRKLVLDNHKYGASSEYGNTTEYRNTTDYRLDPSSSSSEEIHRGRVNNNKSTNPLLAKRFNLAVSFPTFKII